MIIKNSEDINEYLISSSIIDYYKDSIEKVSKNISKQYPEEIDYIKAAYKYVRDKFQHTFDIGAKEVACSASDVIKYGHGICYAKSHLLAAILRAYGIPAGFCYQKLILSDEMPVLIIHGLNGVYIKSLKKWIRLDARGNKKGVNAQFSLGEEKLAFTVREEFGESNGIEVYSEPDANVINALQNNITSQQLWINLPNELHL